MTKNTAPTLSTSNLQALAERKQAQLLHQFPQYQIVFSPESNTQINQGNAPTTWEQSLHHIKPDLEVTEIVKTELAHVFDKLILALQDPALLVDAQLRLYLEQQLTDLLGITLSTELNGKAIPLWQGKVEAIPHSKRSETDTLPTHSQVLEAGLSSFRYEIPSVQQQTNQLDAEQFAFLYPAWLDPEFQHNPQALLHTYVQQQFLLINPTQKRILVVQCVGLRSPSYRFSFAASPETIRQGRFWWPGLSGSALCFVITTPTKTGLLYAG